MYTLCLFLSHRDDKRGNQLNRTARSWQQYFLRASTIIDLSGGILETPHHKWKETSEIANGITPLRKWQQTIDANYIFTWQ